MNINSISHVSSDSESLSNHSHSYSQNLIEFLSANNKEDLLQDPKELAKRVDEMKALDFFAFPPFLEVYFTQSMSLVTNLTASLQTQPQTLKYCISMISHIVQKGVWPWSLILGKSFLGHLQSYSSRLPSELGINKYLQHLGQDTLNLFEEILVEEKKIGFMINVEDKIERYQTLKEKVQRLEERKFPGARRFIEQIEEKITQERTNLEKASEIYSKLIAPSSDEEKIQLIKKECENIKIRNTLLGYLAKKDNFEIISLFLRSLTTRFWSHSVFKEMCLEKAQNIESGTFCSKAANASEWVAIAWNQYYGSKNKILTNDHLFNPKQKEALNLLIQEKVIKRLFQYMMISSEDASENHDLGLEPSTPLSLYLVKNQKTVLFPLSLPDHAMGLLVKPEREEKEATITVYNTGWGLRGNHPESTDGLKNQTYLRKKTSLHHLFNEEVWKKIRKTNLVKEPNCLYQLINEGLGKDGTPETLSSHPLDFESPQYTGSCLIQHMEAMIRDDFMQCEELGSKEMRYAAYRVVISDFILFIGNYRFPVEKRAKILQEENSKEIELLETWQEKELKLQAILNLAKSLKRQEIKDENALEYLYQQLILAKTSENLDNPVTNDLRTALLTYWKSQHHRIVEMIQKKPLQKIPFSAALSFKYSKFQKELAKVIQERLSENEKLMEEFKKQLALRNAVWIH